MSMRGGILFCFFDLGTPPTTPSTYSPVSIERGIFYESISCIEGQYTQGQIPPFFLSHATYSYDWLPILSYLIWIKYDGVNNLLLGDVIAHCNCVCRRLSPRCYLRIKCTHTDTSSFVFCKLASTSLDNNTIVPINSSLDATLW